MSEINEYKINDAVNSYNILSYEEKKKFVERIYEFKLLTVPTLENRLVLISLMNGVFKAFKKKNPDLNLEQFMNKFLDSPSLTESEWFKNFLPFVECMGEECEVTNTFGLKKASEFKTEIMKILDYLLPF